MNTNKKTIIMSVVVILLIISAIFLFKKYLDKQSERMVIEKIDESSIRRETLNIDGLDAVDAYYYMCTIQDGNYYGLKENATREEKEKIYNFHKDEKTMLFELCKKNVDFSLIPCDKELETLGFGSGRIKEFDYDYDVIKRIDNEVPNNGNSFILVKTIRNNIEKTYRLTYGWSDGAFNNIYVKLEEEKDLKDNLILKDNVVLFDSEHIKSNFEELCLDRDKRIVYPQEEWDGTYYGDNVAVSDNFRKKYPYFLDIFIHYSPLEYNKITLKDLDIDNQIATFEVDSRLECKKRTYEVKYILDDNMYLDDVETKILKEVNYEGTSADRENKIFYKNSNWQNLKITENFISKFAELNSVFPDIDNVSYNFKWSSDFYSQIAKKGIGTIKSYKFKDDSINYYYYKSIYENNYLDDVICKKLPYDSSMTLEEVLGAFTVDKKLQKELGIEISE